MNGFFLSQWFAEVLKFMNSFVGNYAVTVILFTVLVKLIIVPLDVKQRKSTLKTGLIQAKVLDIKKRYPSKEKQNEKIQELYRTENISVMSGCLPALISFPILIALIGSVSIIANEEMVRLLLMENADPNKVQPFLWVNNMWQPDSGLASVMPTFQQWQTIVSNASNIPLLNNNPDLLAQAQALTAESYQALIQPILDTYAGYANGWFGLPVLCGVLQLVQAKLMPAGIPSADGKKNSGKTMFYIMAVISILICSSQSALFALYWIMSTVMAVLVQLIINKVLEPKISLKSDEQKLAIDSGKGAK